MQFFRATIYTLVVALIDTRMDIGVPAIFHYKNKDIFKYTCKCLIPAEIGYFSWSIVAFHFLEGFRSFFFIDKIIIPVIISRLSMSFNIV